MMRHFLCIIRPFSVVWLAFTLGHHFSVSGFGLVGTIFLPTFPRVRIAIHLLRYERGKGAVQRHFRQMLFQSEGIRILDCRPAKCQLKVGHEVVEVFKAD